MRLWPPRWDPTRRIRNRAAWHGSADGSANTAPSRGGGRPAGLHACGRVTLTVDEVDAKWAQACRAWDGVRLDIRRIGDDNVQAQAWHLAEQAIRELRDDVRQRFRTDFEEVCRHVDY